MLLWQNRHTNRQGLACSVGIYQNLENQLFTLTSSSVAGSLPPSSSGRMSTSKCSCSDSKDDEWKCSWKLHIQADNTIYISSCRKRSKAMSQLLSSSLLERKRVHWQKMSAVRYNGAVLRRQRYDRTYSQNWICSGIRSQWSSWSIAVVGSDLLVDKISRAVAFRTDCSLLSGWREIQSKTEQQ